MNKETLQEYNGKLEENNVSLANVLTTINNLPETTGGSSSDIYSLEERKVGTWIDGKPIYRKVVELGFLPNNGTKYVPTGLIHTDIRLVRLYGNSSTDDGKYQTGLNDLCTRINTLSDNTLSVTTTANFSDFTGYAILEYTKITD